MPRAAPSPADIAVAIGKVAAGDWIDPLDAPLNWSCTLYNSEGFEIGNGNAHTPPEAMALAWVALQPGRLDRRLRRAWICSLRGAGGLSLRAYATVEEQTGLMLTHFVWILVLRLPRSLSNAASI